ncbi:MAG TPA: sialidase family protein [Acidimicrobiales bacterium]
MTIPSAFSGSSIDQISCATTQTCVVHVFNGGEGSNAGGGTFLTTDDAGATWRAATVVPAAAAASLWTLKCDPDGACLGLVPTGTVSDPSAEGINALRSTDDGQTWTVTSAHLAVGPGTLLISCGDAMHCLAAYNANNGTNIGLATTSDGGNTWRASIAPTSWPNIAISVSCADPADCFVSASDGAQQGYTNPVIEATHDGGTTWTPLTLPKLTDSPLVIVFPLSCPVAAGCIGVAATVQEFSPPRTPPAPGTTPPSEQRVIVSNLSSTN